MNLTYILQKQIFLTKEVEQTIKEIERLKADVENIEAKFRLGMADLEKAYADNMKILEKMHAEDLKDLEEEEEVRIQEEAAKLEEIRGSVSGNEKSDQDN